MAGHNHMLGDVAANLSGRERVALFCAATGIDYPASGVLTSAVQGMRDRGLVARDRTTARYVLTDSGRTVFSILLERAGFRLAE